MLYQSETLSPAVYRSRYLPPPRGSLRRIYHETFLRLAYDVWRRQLRHFGHWSAQDSVHILECGSGPGFLLKFLERCFPEAHPFGLDTSKQLIEEARTQTARTHFVQTSAVEIPFLSATFDLVIALHLVEHLPQPARFFAEARRVLRRNGLLIIATPNPVGIGAKVMGKHWSGWKDESHVILNPPDYWRTLISGHGFTILKHGTTGLSGIPLFRTWPIALINWGPLFLFGFFPWMHGEAYVCIATVDE
jgi:SAM-dependent methyltransferase